MRGACSSLRRVLMLAAVGIVPAVATASPGLVISPSSDVLACLVRPQAAVVYPAGQVERKAGAVVRARFTFEAADQPPQVDIFYNSGQEEFEKTVKRHLRSYRLPCLAAGSAPVTATQEFVFSPGDGRPVFWGPERPEMAAEQSRAIEQCISVGKGKPSYPRPAFKEPPVGTVLARFRFDAVDSPPRVNILFDGGSLALADSVSTHVLQQYRATCAPPAGFPVEAQQSFVFVINGEAEFRFKDVSLREFVGALKSVERNGQVFDFTGMGCPFDVEMRIYQPHIDNTVGEVGDTNANRREFLEWLKKATLNLSGPAAKQLLGGSMKLSIPCAKLDLS